jgi:hypothetical protein
LVAYDLSNRHPIMLSKSLLLALVGSCLLLTSL